MRRYIEQIHDIMEDVDHVKAVATTALLEEKKRDLSEMTVPPKDLKQFVQAAKAMKTYASEAVDAFGRGDVESLIRGFTNLGMAIQTVTGAVLRTKVDPKLAAKLEKVGDEVPRLAMKYFDESDY